MALPTIELDDLTYQQLLDVVRSHIPGEQWSDHNPSDPGITLLELLSWLGEMGLYRMNQVPPTHQDKFLKLLVDPPVPVTVRATLELTPKRNSDFTLPPGLRFATGYRNGRRFIFESFEPAVLPRPETGKPQLGEVRLRAIRELEHVVLGVSDGTPDQVFPLPERPVLVDLDTRAPGYNPNPRIRVGGDEWELRSFLLTEGSQPDPTPPQHFMIEEFENRVRFGDGVFGKIPPDGAAVRLIRAQVLEGPEALIAEGQLEHFLNPQLITGLVGAEEVKLAGNEDAGGGESFFPPEEQMRRGLETFRNPTRLITAADFERVALDDFNEFQRRFNEAQGLPLDKELIQRAVALMNRKKSNLEAVSPGHVTLMILPAYQEASFEAASLADKADLAKPSERLQKRLLAFLEPRRLITTRLHVTGTELKAVTIKVTAYIESQRNTAEMEHTIRTALRSYLSLTRGYDDGRGWPLGRMVRRSQLYRVLEDVPGVDHVESMTLSPANPAGDVPLGPRQLPVWDALNIQIRRT